MVRAHFLQLALNALRQRDESLHRLVERRLPVEFAAIRDARRLAWLPIEYLLALSDLAVDTVGVEGLRPFVHDTMRAAHGSEPWGRLLRLAISAFGLGPSDVARWAPAVYRLTFRGVGRMTVDHADDRGADIRFDGVPRHCLEHPHHIESLRHALEYFFELTNTHGRVTSRGAVAGTARFRLDVHGS